MPRFQADNVTGKTCPVIRDDVLGVIADNPDADRRHLAAILGCSEQTVQRRLEGNNVRGGKSGTHTRVLLISGLVERWASDTLGFSFTTVVCGTKIRVGLTADGIPIATVLLTSSSIC